MQDSKVKRPGSYRDALSAEKMDELQGKILRVLVLDKKYLDKEYSAKHLAEDIGTNTRYISAVINSRFHVNYSEFVNKQRIDDAMSMLTDKRFLQLSICDIADKVGFSNRQSFYSAFFKFQGTTPRKYRVEYLSQHPELQRKANTKK